MVIKVIHSGETANVLNIKGRIIGSKKLKPYGISNDIIIKIPLIKNFKIQSKYFFTFITMIYIIMLGYLSSFKSKFDIVGGIFVIIMMIFTFIKILGKDIPNHLKKVILQE